MSNKPAANLDLIRRFTSVVLFRSEPKKIWFTDVPSLSVSKVCQVCLHIHANCFFPIMHLKISLSDTLYNALHIDFSYFCDYMRYSNGKVSMIYHVDIEK